MSQLHSGMHTTSNKSPPLSPNICLNTDSRRRSTLDFGAISINWIDLSSYSGVFFKRGVRIWCRGPCAARWLSNAKTLRKEGLRNMSYDVTLLQQLDKFGDWTQVWGLKLSCIVVYTENNRWTKLGMLEHLTGRICTVFNVASRLSVHLSVWGWRRWTQ